MCERDRVASRMPPFGNVARNPGMCPDWESNPRPFSLQGNAQSTEPHQLGPGSLVFKGKFKLNPVFYPLFPISLHHIHSTISLLQDFQNPNT